VAARARGEGPARSAGSRVASREQEADTYRDRFSYKEADGAAADA